MDESMEHGGNPEWLRSQARKYLPESRACLYFTGDLYVEKFGRESTGFYRSK